MQRAHRFPIAFVVLTLALTAVPAAQRSPKRPITHDVYDSWRSI